MKRRVVITGIGPATAIGIGIEEMFNNVLAMKTHIVEIPHHYEKNYTFKSRYFVPEPEFSLTDYGFHKSIENLMEEISRLSVLCTKLALEDAKFKIKKNNHYFEVDWPKNSMSILGVGMSSLQTAFDSYTAHISETADRKNRFNRMVIPMLMPNSASSWVSILYGTKGFNYTVNAACASGSLAIGEAFNHIMNGECEVAITGGVEALKEENGAVMRGFDMLTTLTKSRDGKPYPFSKNRNGFLFNEGAGCVLILEELENAKRRGADIYAEIVGYECSSDAHHIVQMDPSGRNITEILKKLTMGVKIDYLNAHGTATYSNDEIEAKVIQEVFGDEALQPYINSTKGIIGHSIGANGAIEAAITAMSIKKSMIHGNLTLNPIENLNLPMVSIPVDIDYAVSASYGFGGHNVLLLLKRYVDHE